MGAMTWPAKILWVFVTVFGAAIFMVGCVSFDALKSSFTSSPALTLEQADNYSRDGLYREAIAIYKELLANSHPDRLLIHRNLGIVLTQIGLYNQAEMHLRRAVKAFPKNYQSRYYYAEVKRVLKQWQKSVHHYQVALVLRPKDMRASRGLAWSYYNLARYSESLKLLRQLPPEEQNDAQIMIIRARVHLKLGNHGASAAILLSDRWQHYPFYRPYRQSLLGDIYLHRQQPKRAQKHYERALALRPHLSSALVGKAKVYYQQGNHKEAIVLLTRSLRVKGDLSEPYLYLAKIVQSSDPHKALEFYRKFAQLAARKTEFANQMAYVQDNIVYLENKIYGHSSTPASSP